MSKVTIITPFLFEKEIENLKTIAATCDVEWLFEEDKHRIGADMMYQKLWKQAAPNDVIIFHSDMSFLDNAEAWLTSLLGYVQQYPEAGMIGCKLLYPEKTSENGNYLIQCAGGKFTAQGNPDHFGSGLELFSGKEWKTTEEDVGQYDSVREVAWTTFGGLYIRREVLDRVGDYDPTFEWAYNRDVDYCLTTRQLGYKIYQVPTPLFHFESKDIKRARTAEQAQAEMRNLTRLKEKWINRPDLYRTINNEIHK